MDRLQKLSLFFKSLPSIIRVDVCQSFEVQVLNQNHRTEHHIHAAHLDGHYFDSICLKEVLCGAHRKWKNQLNFLSGLITEKNHEGLKRRAEDSHAILAVPATLFLLPRDTMLARY